MYEQQFLWLKAKKKIVSISQLVVINQKKVEICFNKLLVYQTTAINAP